MPLLEAKELFGGAYFERPEDFEHYALLNSFKYAWEPLKNLGSLLEELLKSKRQKSASIEGISDSEQGLFVQDWTTLTAPSYFERSQVWLGEGVILEPTAIVKGPAVIGDHTAIRQGAYLRGNVLVGRHCVLGHATELKNSVIMDHSEAGHFNYIGDSILGSYVNMGAGSRLANLQFRTSQEKEEGFIRPMSLGNEEGAQMEKMGAVLGDHVELGCNAVICPGTFIGKHSWVYPNTTVAKGFYPPRHFFRLREKAKT
ncbi:MAG: hypothetical protein COV66_07455 [Nitrospinae bacterium CG11_big_fil_rev_8_21_14_0_20_45_15]|nr:MAG: hypothetical protein COV66_07455 [Nitrospinae bacterium CG11_big_fil_rev_8_21_14_0_20_45_15]